MSKRKYDGDKLSDKISLTFLNIAQNFNQQLEELSFINKIDYVYNPTCYAYLTYKTYVENYCSSYKHVMYLGMNPGPWGMSQTGVPFGEVEIVKDWLKIEGRVDKPKKELAQRPILGFKCHRSEISGKRFWGLMKEICGEPSKFFDQCFVYNYLPLQFMKANGKNVPPTALKSTEQAELFNVCDRVLLEVIKLYRVKIVVGIGKFAEARAKLVLNSTSLKDDIKIVSILHPSPQSKAANNWRVDARRQLEELGLIDYLY